VVDDAQLPVEYSTEAASGVARLRTGRRAGYAALGAAILAALLVLAVLIVALVALRSDDEPFSVRVTAVGPSEVCYSAGDSAVQCVDRRDLVDLPADVAVGECLRIRTAHPVLRFVERESCS
jgi:hypothetical protein